MKKTRIQNADIEWLKNNIRCQNTCAIHTNVPRYVHLIAQGKFLEAYAVIRETNPFPSVCGRVCHHPCEGECQRAKIDAPVAIDALKRFVSDFALKSGKKLPVINKKPNGKKIAIVGAGPVGLTAGHDLARLGYAVVVFEAEAVAGGMLALCIPEYRLPKKILNFEIDHIRDHGVEIKTNVRIGKDVSFEYLRKNFDAVLIATGAHKGMRMGIEGEDEYEGVLDCIEFLKAVNRGDRPGIGRKIAVTGGGNSAVDAARVAFRFAISDVARSALRLDMEQSKVSGPTQAKAEGVTIIYRRGIEDMPANSWEIEEALHEGIKIHYFSVPIRVIGNKGKVVGLLCNAIELGEQDASGRRSPVPIKDSEFLVSADTVIPAVGQVPDLSFLPEKHGLKISKWGTIEADPKTLITNIPGVFAGGDAVTGPASVVNAIAIGHRAAMYINKYVKGEKLDEIKEEDFIWIETGEDLEMDRNYDSICRQKMPTLPLKKRMGVFDEVETGFTEEMAIREAKRCLRCNYQIYIEDKDCINCGRCCEVCPYNCIQMVSLQGKDMEDFRPWLNGNIRMKNESLCIRCGLCKQICPVGSVNYKKIDWKKVITGAAKTAQKNYRDSNL